MESHEFTDACQIGMQLSDARSLAGMTIADLAAHTKIATRYLEAIEREEFDCLPSRVHILGFTRAFARAVNADEAQVVGALRQRLLEGAALNANPVLAAAGPNSFLAPLAAAVQSCTSAVAGGLNLLAGRSAR